MKKTRLALIVLAFVLPAVAVAADATATISNVVGALQAANSVSAPFNPYAGIISVGLPIVGALATAIAGLFMHKANTKTKKTKAAVAKHLTGQISAAQLHSELQH